jgi:hypothetical protein
LQHFLQQNRLFSTSASVRRQQRCFSQHGFSQPQQAGFAHPQQAGFSQPQQAGFAQPQQAGFSQHGLQHLRQRGFSQHGFSQPQQAGFGPQPQGFSQPQHAGFAQQAGSGQQALAWQHDSHFEQQHFLHSNASFRPANRSRTGVDRQQHFFSQPAFSQQAGSGAQHFAAVSQQAGFSQAPHAPQPQFSPHKRSAPNPWL